MKKIISILLLSLLLVCCLPMGALKANAAEYKENGWKYTVYNGEATVVGYQSATKSLTIPSKLGGYPVTIIGSRAFENYTGMTGVTIPDSVKTIEAYAFNDLKQLSRVTIGNGVTEIKEFAFYGCYNLRTVTLGNSVGIIEGDVFSGCESLTTINFPEKLTHIYQNAFSGCKSLKKLTLPDNVKYIGKAAFSQCTGLTEVTLGTGITTIYASGFADCTSLKTLRVSNNLLTVEANAFKNCSALKNVYHTGDEAKMQKLRQNVKSTGNEYLKNATWNHVCAFANVDGKTPTCTETGKLSYYQCSFCGKCSQTSDGSMSISNIDKWGILEATGHSGGAWQSDGTNHWKICTTCKAKVDTAGHSGGTWKSDGNNHWKTCSVCQQKAYEPHSGGKSTCQAKAQCNICNAAYGNLGNHIWTKTWDHSDAEGHYHFCQTPGCDQLSPVTAHAPSAPATETREQVCTVCNYIITPKLNHKHTTQKYAAVKATCEKNGNLEYYACTGCSKLFKDAAATKEYADLNSVLVLASGHKYTENWSMNETEHWRACTACGIKEGTEKHTPGAEATETTDQTCTICSYVIKKAVSHTHTFSEYWFSDEASHWHACACGEVSEKATHADADGNQVCDSCSWAMETGTEGTEPTEQTEATEGSNKKPDKEQTEKPEDDGNQGGIDPMIIVVCILGVVLLATGTVLVVILVKRKKQ